MSGLSNEKNVKQTNDRLFTNNELVIRQHNRSLMKFILLIVTVILVLFMTAWYLDNQDAMNIISGGAVCTGLIAVWVMIHTPEVKLNHIKLKSEK